MIKFPSDTTVLTEENFVVLIAILEEMRDSLMADLNEEGLSERAISVLNSDFHRLREIEKQLALTMEVINK
tara:strand:+ start:43 stop:255 length:213 start_codon:yes stop_codon:yes gene_type:complete